MLRKYGRNVTTLVSLAVYIFVSGLMSASGQTSSGVAEFRAASFADAVKNFRNHDAAFPPSTSNIKRWLEIESFALSARYRYVRRAGIDTVESQVQYRVAARGRFKFDAKGRYSIVAGLFTGNSFSGGWNSTGVGTGQGQTNLFLKQLYFDAKPNKNFEFQVGSLQIDNGENTEATGYDNDGYITGVRAIVRPPRRLFFDEVSATAANLGDLNRPNAFRRLDEIANWNYVQVLFRKSAWRKAAFSADYTYERGSDTLRQAVKIKSVFGKFIDSLVLENYERLGTPTRYGFNILAEKKVGGRLTLNGGFARTDALTLNGDRYPQGKRFYIWATVNFTKEFSVNAALFQGVGRLRPNIPQTRFDFVISYNILETLRRLNLQ